MSMRSRPSTDSFRQAFFPWHCYAHLLCDESPMKRDPYVATIVQRKPGDAATFAAVRRAQLGTSLLLMNLATFEATFAAQATTQVRVVYTVGSSRAACWLAGGWWGAWSSGGRSLLLVLSLSRLVTHTKGTAQAVLYLLRITITKHPLRIE